MTLLKQSNIMPAATYGLGSAIFGILGLQLGLQLGHILAKLTAKTNFF